jgi:alcohol dehydrogenase YqhD (iron-dependent ADH family)
MPTRLSELGIGAEKLEQMAGKLVYFDRGRIGNNVKLNREDVITIYQTAM